VFLLASAVMVAVYPWLPVAVAVPVAIGSVAGSAGAAFVGGRHAGASRVPFQFIGVSTALLAVTGIGLLGHNLVTGDSLAYTSVVQVAAIPSYLLVLAGLVVLRRRQQRHVELHGIALDSLLVTVAAGFAVWFLIVQPEVAGEASTQRLTAAMIGVVLDLPAAYLALRAMLASSGRNAAGRWLALGILVLLPADAAFAMEASTAAVAVNSPIVAGWMAAFALWGVAALHPSAADLARPVARPTNPVLWSVTVWVSLAAIVVATAVAGHLGAPINGTLRSTVVLVVLTILALRVTRLLRDLDTANTELAAANAGKDELLAAVAHDLRSPLAVVVGMAETLRTHAPQLSDAEVAHLSGRVVARARRLESYVDDLLLVSRGDLGRLMPAQMRVRLADVVTQIAAERGDDTVVDIRTDVWVSADRDHLVRVVTNLVDNAFKYGAAPVVIEVAREGDAALVAVEDGGKGVPATFVPSLFERFARDETTAGLPGSGLGLSIVRSLVTANGGEVNYEPRGRGARFVVRLPSADPAEPGQDPGPLAMLAGHPG
jgi:signal transduction histidine kinase